ncbi:acyl-CoA-like ligand-binding transcription factor [Actinomadura violacea]|uniref:TetR family transcriptional regulator n=1 Tax=Actinomadura violacea TaxID=2819934 RepID=A0ABS3RNA8_9ACTN|nr:TetR family transcriptional regulator [Actinomadura violacea]MBO2458147.1 TetR family transcriptional regulator [Actinomadura violacea]
MALLSAGGDRWRALLAETDPGLGLAWALESAAVASLSAGDGVAGEGLRWTRGLLRAAQDDPALRAVWCQVNADSEEKLLPVLGRLAGPDADPLEIRLVAAAATSAIRVSLEAWATTEPTESPAELVVRCLRELTGGLSLLAPQR